MSSSILLLYFASFVALSLVLVGYANTMSENYWRYLIRNTEKHLRYANRFENPRKLVAGYLCSLIAISVLMFLSGVVFMFILVILVLALVIPNPLFRLLSNRRKKQISKALPDSLAQIASAMQAGSTFQSALQAQVDNSNGALDQEYAIVLRDCRVGVRMEDALENLAQRTSNEEIDLLVSAATIAQDVGGNLSDALQGLSGTIRRKVEMEEKIQSLTAQGRLQGHVVTALPLVMLFGLSVVEPTITLPIFSSLLGWMVLFVMFVLQVAGGLMIRKIVSIDI